MVKEINRDPFILAKASNEATINDEATANDLLDTLIANRDRCVGMAANMIGVNKRIIAFVCDNDYMIMYNPVIINQKVAYEAEEGGLSLDGVRKAERYKKIKVKWYDNNFKVKIKTFEGFTAQIIQHEIDHCNGILI